MNRRSSFRRLGLALGCGLLCGLFVVGVASAESRSSWFEHTRLVDPDAQAYDNLGNAVAIDGDLLVIGAQQAHPDFLRPGAADIFERDAAGVWNFAFHYEDGGHDLGWAVAVDGETVAVADIPLGWTGAGTDLPADDIGHVAILGRDGAGGWAKVAEIRSPDGTYQAQFGYALDLEGDRIAVGAPLQNGDARDTGAVYIAERKAGGAGNWDLVAKLRAPVEQRGLNFGAALALDGDRLLVGAPGYDTSPSDLATAFVFERTVDGVWVLVAELAGSGLTDDHKFGIAVALEDDLAVVGAPYFTWQDSGPGQVHLFRRDAGGADAWSEVGVLMAPDSGGLRDDFGAALALAGETLVIGAGYHIENPFDARGQVYVHRRDLGGVDAWGQAAVLVGVPVDWSSFGRAVDISGPTLAVGSPDLEPPGLPDIGAAYLFEEIVVDPRLEVAGACPGELILTASALTPSRTIGLYGSRREGQTTIAEGPCSGRVLGLDAARLLAPLDTDADGAAGLVVAVGAGACGASLQVLDETSCGLSGVVAVP